MRDELPIDRLQRVERSREILIYIEQPFDLLRFEADVGIDEKQMRGCRVVQKCCEQGAARACDEGIAAKQRQRNVKTGRSRIAHEPDDG